MHFCWLHFRSSFVMKTFGFKKKETEREREREKTKTKPKKEQAFLFYIWEKKVLRFSFKRNSIFTKELLLVFGACVSGPNGWFWKHEITAHFFPECFFFVRTSKEDSVCTTKLCIVNEFLPVILPSHVQHNDITSILKQLSYIYSEWESMWIGTYGHTESETINKILWNETPI